MPQFSVGTHNLYDDHGNVTFFADLIVFTEALPFRVRRAIKDKDTPYRAVVCASQPDLVVVYDNRVFKRALFPAWYRKYVGGMAKVTPNRGTFTVALKHRKSKRRVRVNAEHRINAAFHPFVRGEATFRETSWQRHTAGTLGQMKRQAARGHIVIGAGDVNTPRGIPGYPGFNEVGHGYDRIASNVELSAPVYLTTVGSDHRRLRTRVRWG